MLGVGTVVLFAASGPILAQPCDSLLSVAFTYALSGNTITLTDQSSVLLSDVHYYWMYGDGVIEHLGAGIHTYADTGTYQVCLSVSGSTGVDTCSAVHCETVVVTGSTSGPDGFAVGPVPFSAVVYLYGADSDARVTLFDADGSVVWQGTPTAEAGRLRIEPVHLAPGAYSGLLTTAGAEQRFRLVKAHR